MGKTYYRLPIVFILPWHFTTSPFYQGCLFNVAEDMEERNDLAKAQPDVLKVGLICHCILGPHHSKNAALSCSRPHSVSHSFLSLLVHKSLQSMLAKLQVESKSIWNHSPGKAMILGYNLPPAAAVCRCFLFYYSRSVSIRLAQAPAIRRAQLPRKSVTADFWARGWSCPTRLTEDVVQLPPSGITLRYLGLGRNSCYPFLCLMKYSPERGERVCMFVT